MTTAVYAIFDDLEPVYIGISGNPTKRLSHHKATRPWWNDRMWMRPLVECETRDAALALEAELIERLRPRCQWGIGRELTDGENAEIAAVMQRIATEMFNTHRRRTG